MYRILKTRLVRVTAASLAGLMLAAPIAPLSAASAAVSPAIDRTFAAPTPNSEPDPFYTPPSPLPTGNPGDIIRARVAQAGPPTARSLAKAWQVMYLSTDALGKPNVVTGTILVPRGANPATTPIVGFAPGTTGPAFRCTVSRFINSGSFYEQPAVNDMLKAGYAVAVTDYEGYYQNPKTTYILGKTMGPALLDAVRAAKRLPDAGLSADAKVLVRGYSQGGGAAMWAGELAPTYAPDLNLIGVAGGGVPAALGSVALSLEGKKPFGFLLNALIGLDNAYPELLLDNYLSASGKATVANSEADDCTVELLLSYAGKSISDLTSGTSPLSNINWLLRVDENTLGRKKINVPVYQYQGTNDEIVPYAQAKTLRDTYCSAGMSVQWKELPTGHITGVARGNADVNAFLAARVAGQAPTPNC